MSRNRTPKWLEAARKGAAPGQGTWLARTLGRRGVVPGGEVEKAIRSGRVQVNGALVRDPMHPVKAADELRFDGAIVSRSEASRVLMFHKPAGSVVAASDPERGSTVFVQLKAAISPELARYVWHAVGRLDRATTGLLLFTTDPAFVEHVTSPSRGIEKRYVARVDGRPTDSQLEPVRRGVTIEDGPVDPAEARLVGPGVVELVLREGRHHQARRMLNAVGLPVLALHRESIGGLRLDVPEGAVRELSANELRAGLAWM